MTNPSAPVAPTLLHEQEGLRIVENAKNKFLVVTLHYTADPAKRSPEWKREAAAGMHPAKFAQEYEIDYTALFGEKVFPELSANRSTIIIHEPYPELDDDQIFWGGLDYGARNPSSLHIYTIIDGVTYALWELFEPCRSLVEFTQKILECPYYSKIKYIAADPSIWYKNQQTKTGNLTSIYNLFVENRLTKLIPGVTDEAAWLAQMRQHWQDEDNPTFRIYDCCPNMIREFESAIYTSASDRLLQTKNYYESISDHDNHALDDCKYFMNSRPKLVRTTAKFKDVTRRWIN